MGKKNKPKIPAKSIALTRDTLRKILENIKEYKESYTIIWLVLSFILTTIWHISCGMGYKGYADYWSIASQYMYKDNFNILISFVLSLGFAAVLLFIAYEIAKRVALSPKHWIITIFIGVIVVGLPFIVLVLMFILGWLKNIIELAIGCMLIACIWFLLYIPIFILLLDVQKSKNTSNSTTNNNQHTSNHSPFITISSLLKSVCVFALIVLIFFIVVYFYGWLYASLNREFAFITDKSTSSSILLGEHKVILSETDEYYYLAECTITTEVSENNIKKYILEINPESYTILKKEDKTSIIKINFDGVEKI